MRLYRFIVDRLIVLVITSIIFGAIFDEFVINNIMPFIPIFLAGMMASAGLMIDLKHLRMGIRPLQLIVLIMIQYISSTFIGFIISITLYQGMTEYGFGQILHAAMPSEQTIPIYIKIANGDLGFGIIALVTSSMVSPLLTPFSVWIFSSEIIEIDYLSLLLTLTITVLLPTLISSSIRTKFSSISRYEETFTITSIASALPTTMIIGAIAHSYLDASTLIVAIASIIHFISTAFIGFIISRNGIFKKSDLAVLVFNISMKEFTVTLAVVASMGLDYRVGIPASIYGIIHIISAPLLAKLLSKWSI